MKIILKIRQLRFLLAAVLLLLAGFALAESPSRYEIEVVVFSHITDQGLKSEYWPLLPPLKIPSDAVEFSSEQLLPESRWRLKTIHQQLTHNQYPVLLHLAWVQTGNDLRRGQTVRLFSDQMEGTLNIQLEHYFQVHFNCRFFLPWETIEEKNLPNLMHEPNNPDVSFKINESFRLRSNELNYVDHPLYGILIQITSIENGDDEPATQPIL